MKGKKGEKAMAQNMHGLHHFHKRKRVHQNLEEYPHPEPFKAFMDRFIYFVVCATLIMSLPQVFKIWLNKDAGSISLITWIVYSVGNFFWLAYAFLHKDRTLIFTYLGWLVINALMVIGTLLYG